MDAAIEALELEFNQCSADLQFVLQKLEVEFAHQYPNPATNPMKLLSRIDQIKEGLPSLLADFGAVVSAKQNLVESAYGTLKQNRGELQVLSQLAGLTPNEDANEDMDTLTECVDLWRSQYKLLIDDKTQSSGLQGMDLDSELAVNSCASDTSKLKANSRPATTATSYDTTAAAAATTTLKSSLRSGAARSTRATSGRAAKKK
eukprot:gnl/Hemi2/20132_TR6674_c0_g1_i1.p1 gnl/Hemi2/20132_TR6674_c0_g1~~gnl/Hemi2/20132_TR6674_c0_g1_i1.p1  ORF type:complete len:234 (-),score=52.25 gnl/Hemi2/20132_TR6674_c0_g1_i1:72-680(-)